MKNRLLAGLTAFAFATVILMTEVNAKIASIYVECSNCTQQDVVAKLKGKFIIGERDTNAIVKIHALNERDEQGAVIKIGYFLASIGWEVVEYSTYDLGNKKFSLILTVKKINK